MTNVCNIFKELSNSTGNFLLFSQYVNDLTRATASGDVKVRPSKFMCLNLDPTPFGGSDLNETIPQFFQNEFENAVACLKNEDIEYGFSSVFWYELKTKLSDLTSSIKYIGNISTAAYDNSGFADIILDIPSGTAEESYSNTAAAENTISYNQGSYIEGWSVSDNIPIDGTLPGGTNITATSYDDKKDITINDLFTRDSNFNSNDYFSFNTIIVFYEVTDNNNEPTTEDIPLGIYFTGDVESDVIVNPVTIYKSSADAYGAGSGWSLRICTKFSPTPQGHLGVEEISIESGAALESISGLISACGEAITTLNSFTKDLSKNSDMLKDLYLNFKNTRTNVPYVREVNGVKYWFVNGRNTGVKIDGTME